MFAMRTRCGAAAALLMFAGGAIHAQEPFKDLVGPVQVGAVKKSDALEVPYITWGGDVATFHANGGKTTAPGTLFAGHGLKLNLVAGDDFVEQVRRYVKGDTPFLRGTFNMIGLASEVLGENPQTKPVIFLQMTWSAGDHLVSREGLKQTNDLKGKKVVLQKGGPHVGMLHDILRLASLKWSDITVVWTDQLTGEGGPADMFRKDASIDACLVISPDMEGLTGGLESVGTGAEGTVKGAHVLDSTAYLSESIADVYACRKDFFDANKAMIEKFTAGYLKACEEIVLMKRDYDEKGSSADYMKVLQLTQDIYGKELIPTLEIDAHGLISDCTYVLLPGNVKFFTQENNLTGFESKQKQALDLAVGEGYAAVRTGFFAPGFDYGGLATLGKLAAKATTRSERFGEIDVDVDIDPANVDPRTILSFTINFEPNQPSFPPEVYGSDFQKAIEAAALYGNAVLSIRGHADPSLTLGDVVRAGMKKGIITRSGGPGRWKYFLNRRPLDLEATDQIVKLLESGALDGADPNPRQTMQAALNLSLARAKSVADEIVKYAEAQNIQFDRSQLKPVGVGIADPLIAKPRSIEDAKVNMRVEFRILKLPAETTTASDFDF